MHGPLSSPCHRQDGALPITHHHCLCPCPMTRWWDHNRTVKSCSWRQAPPLTAQGFSMRLLGRFQFPLLLAWGEDTRISGLYPFLPRHTSINNICRELNWNTGQNIGSSLASCPVALSLRQAREASWQTLHSLLAWSIRPKAAAQSKTMNSHSFCLTVFIVTL